MWSVSKNIFKSIPLKYMNISYNRKPQTTHVVTKLVVSITLDKYDLVFSVEHWKSLKGLRVHINIDMIAPIEPTESIKLKLLKILYSFISIWKALRTPIKKPGINTITQKILNFETNVLPTFSNSILKFYFTSK